MKTATAHTNNSLQLQTFKSNGIDHSKTNTYAPPFASDESIIKYDTKMDRCNCNDFLYRGGSYTLNGGKVCKHMFRQNTPYALFGTPYRKALAEYAAKNAKLAKASKPSSQLVAVAAQDRYLDPTSCDAQFLELDDPFAAFA